MTNVSEWSITPGSNNASPPDGWPEGMARSAVNDCAREMMASIAKWYQDQRGVLETAGTSTAYTLTTNNAFNSLADIPLLVFRIHVDCGTDPTLNVDGLGALPLYKDARANRFQDDDLQEDQLIVAAYNVAQSAFNVIGPTSDFFEPGTRMLFASDIPTGWFLVTTANDYALRLVNTDTGGATGGSTPFSAVFDDRVIEQENLPDITLSHSLSGVTGTVVLSVDPENASLSGSGDDYLESAFSGTSPVVVTGTISLGGDDVPMDFDVDHVDVAMGERDGN